MCPNLEEPRRFSAEDKLRIVEEADACSDAGELDALLRREGLSAARLDEWRGELEEARPDPALQREVERRRRENARLQARLEQAEMIIEVQRRLMRELGLEGEEGEEDESE